MATIGTDVYKVGFDTNILRTVEVKGGKLRSKVRMVSGDLYRKEGVYQRMSGGGLPNRRLNRFGDSPVSKSDYSRRRVTRMDFEDGQFMDWADLKRMCVDPRSEKLDIMLQKFRRQEDLIITSALLGTAKGGDNGETNTAFDTDNIVDVTLGAASGVTNAGFTYDKFIATLEKFGSNNVDIESMRPTIVISFKQWKDMMKDEKFINFDYSTARPVDGSGSMLANYMGCDFVITNIVPFMASASAMNVDLDDDVSTDTGAFSDTDSTDIRACFAFAPDAALLEINPDIESKIAERADKGFNWYAYIKMSLGAVRMEEEKVIVIPCDQNPT